MTLQNNSFLIYIQFMRYLLIKLFHLSNLLQMWNDLWIVNIEFFSNLSCSCKWIIFDDPFNGLLSTSDGQSLCSQTPRLLSPLQNFLNHYCTVCLIEVLGQIQLLMLQVVSTTLWPILDSNEKMVWICFLSNITSIV